MLGRARTLIDAAKVREEWPLQRKLAWFALYFSLFIWMRLIIFPI